MLKFPGDMTPAGFLSGHWQKTPLCIPQATPAIRPSVSRNELAWLATLDDVESRLVFTDRDDDRRRYRVESGPFDVAYLQELPDRDWTLLVHDVEKHLPALRRLFALVPFIPDWRIDDLMISFAAPGGGVGPHRDNYDVFLCQGIGIREWKISKADIAVDTAASKDLVLLHEFAAEECHRLRQGDILYLPPGIAHWGTALRACMTYSIGMRAPPGYADPDLALAEVAPGYLSPAALARGTEAGTSLGRHVTELKDWLRPVPPVAKQIALLLENRSILGSLRVHGMARIACDDESLYVNGEERPLGNTGLAAVKALCLQRRLDRRLTEELGEPCLRWLLANGAFEMPDVMSN